MPIAVGRAGKNGFAINHIYGRTGRDVHGLAFACALFAFQEVLMHTLPMTSNISVSDRRALGAMSPCRHVALAYCRLPTASLPGIVSRWLSSRARSPNCADQLLTAAASIACQVKGRLVEATRAAIGCLLPPMRAIKQPTMRHSGAVGQFAEKRSN